MGKAAVKGMHQTSGTSSQAGFTLLELIVGLTVGAILLTAIYTTFVGVSQTQRRVERVLNKTSTWRFVTETLRQDLSRLSSSSTFEGSASGFTTEMFEGAGEAPVVLTGPPAARREAAAFVARAAGVAPRSSPADGGFVLFLCYVCYLQ